MMMTTKLRSAIPLWVAGGLMAVGSTASCGSDTEQPGVVGAGGSSAPDAPGNAGEASLPAAAAGGASAVGESSPNNEVTGSLPIDIGAGGAGPGVSAPPAAADAGAPLPRPSFRMTAQALGVNTTNGDRRFADPVVPGLLADAKIGVVRYPGGSGADNTNNFQATTSPLPWATYMRLMGQIDAAPMITINYGTLSQGPATAAAWVRDALTYPNYDKTTALWVLGNEGYGPWERDQHPDPHTPASYATNSRPYFVAMHEADPGARVGFPMTLDRTIAGGTGTWVADPDLWNRTVLQQNADHVDFIDFHWYPIFGIPVLSNAQLFETVDRIPGVMKYLTSIVDEYDPNTPIVVSESNVSQSEIVYNCQPVAALYAVTTALTWLSQGASSFMWWQVHNSDNMNGDFGFLSDATGTPGPSATTLAAAAQGGARNIAVASTDGFYYGHQFTIDTGGGLESRKITAIGGAATLAAAVAAGDVNLKVSSVVPFAPGTPVTVGGEARTVVSVGTRADTSNLAAPAAAGSTTIQLVGTGMGGQAIPVFMPIGFVAGAAITVGTGANAETATIVSVSTSSSLGTTLAAASAVGATTIRVASVADTNIGIANYVGDPITIGTGADEEVRTITRVTSTDITLSAPLERAHPTGTPTRDAGAGLTLSAPLRNDHGTATAVSTPGTGITLSAGVGAAHAAGANVTSTGITFTPALGRAHPGGVSVNELGLREPPVNTPMPAYWGFVLASMMTTPGAELSEVTPASSPRVRAFASHLPGTESIALVNTDDVNPVTLQVSGLDAGDLKTFEYGLQNPAIVEGTSSAGEASAGLVLAPESIVILVASAGDTPPTISVRQSDPSSAALVP